LPLLALLLAGCGGVRVPPDSLYQEVRSEIRRGNLDHALAQADRGYREWRRQPDSKPYWQFRTAKAEVLLAQGKARDALPLLDGDIPAGPAFRELAVRRLMLQGAARTLLAEFSEARRLLEKAAVMAPDTASPILQAEVDLRIGTALGLSGDSAGAERHYRKALEAAVRQRDLYLQASALGGVGFSLLRSERVDEAIPWFEQALTLAEKAGARGSVANTLGNLGLCYYELGDFEKADPLTSRAAGLFGEIGDLYRRQSYLRALGDQAFYGRGDIEKATSYYQQALALARQIGERASAARCLERMTDVALSSGDLVSAEEYNREALALSRQIGVRSLEVWALFAQAEIQSARREFTAAQRGFRGVIAAASDYENRHAVWAAHTKLGAIYAQTQRWGEAETEFQTALSTLERTRAKLARDEWKLSFQSGAKEFYQDYVNFLMDRGQSERALEVVESSRARMLAQKLGVLESTLRLPGASRFREMAQALDATLVSVWLGPKRSFLWVVTPKKVESAVLPGEAEFSSAVQAYRGAIQSLRDPLETANPAGRRLSELLLAPITRFAPSGTRVVLAPDGALHELNLEALPAISGKPHYWLEDVTLVVVPSLALLAPGSQSKRADSNSLLLIGDPIVSGSEFAPLPDAEKEVGSLRRRFPGPGTLVLTSAAARPGAYREANPGRFSLIHFSAHATSNRENPLESAVILSKQGEAYKLYAREVIGLPLRARLVTISACRSAGARIYSGEGLVGFAWAFLEAGAQNVIAGLWEVNDRSTAILMDRLYAEIAAGRAPAAALRAAKLDLLKSSGAYRKPYYWAPFQVFTRQPAF
jgi:CHAT domain-containing protein/Flp pilus assembly protein TadD